MSEDYQLKKNSTYGFYQAFPTPSKEMIKKYYTEEFYSSAYRQFNNSSLEMQEKDKEYNDLHREEIYQKLCELTNSNLRGTKILDFGCGFGHTLEFFNSKGAKCYGCDPSEEAIGYGLSQGLNVVATQLDDFQFFKDEKFDIVLLLNVLEHVADPISTISKIKKEVLKSEGLLVIEVPNDYNVFQECACLVYNLPKWWFSPPAHLNYFNQDTLTQLLSGKEFKIEFSIGSFPLEIFLLFGENYIENKDLGRLCHEKRVRFEKNLKQFGFERQLQAFYKALADMNLGRQLLVYARS